MIVQRWLLVLLITWVAAFCSVAISVYQVFQGLPLGVLLDATTVATVAAILAAAVEKIFRPPVVLLAIGILLLALVLGTVAYHFYLALVAI